VPLGLALLALLVPRPAAGAPAPRERWRWPVHGEVVGGFRYAPRHPFAAGGRRGVDVAAAPGAVVRSACAGRVTYAGPVPGRGLGVTVRCGALVATHLGLGRLAVRRGADVGAGGRLGAVGPAGRLRLGARRAASRFGYVDPLALLGAESPGGRGPGAAPLGRAPRGPLAPAVRRPIVPRPAPRPRPRQAAAPSHGATPIPGAALAGLVLLAAGVPLGGLVHRRRRRRARAAEPTVAAVAGR
jgi:peptidase M23-like protein